MRHALPLWHCLSQEAQAKLASIVNADGSTFISPPSAMVEWEPKGKRVISGDYKIEKIGRFMRQKPRHLKLVK